MSVVVSLRGCVPSVLLVNRVYQQQPMCFASRKKDDNPEIPRNQIAYAISAQHQKGYGIIYDNKPFRVRLEKDRFYMWCLCGQSHQQPFCDGTHIWPELHINLKPLRLKVEKTGDYWLCNCKQTKNRPFCDGTHKQEEIQKAKTVFKNNEIPKPVVVEEEAVAPATKKK